MKPREKVVVIAEVGVNHNGSVTQAKRLIDLAAGAGADIVKFQTYEAESNYSVLGTDKSRYQWARSLQFDHDVVGELMAYCAVAGIGFLSSPFDIGSVDLLFDKGLRVFKVASSELCNFPLLRHVVKKANAIYLSVGMATASEMDLAMRVIREHSASSQELTLLYCVSRYPAMPDDHNLGMINALSNRYDVSVGFSDHSQGIELAIAAVALGATVIEKHIKLSPDHECPDAVVSLSPKEFGDLVRGIRKVEKAVVGENFALATREGQSRNLYRKGLYSIRSLRKGQKVTEQDIAFLKPGGGIGIQNYFRLIGNSMKKNIDAGELFSDQHVDIE
jgi:N,N'-diacetyllegionaminate synthase